MLDKVGEISKTTFAALYGLEFYAQGVDVTLLASIYTLAHCVEPHNLAGEGVGVEDMEVNSHVVFLAEYTVFSHDLIGF